MFLLNRSHFDLSKVLCWCISFLYWTRGDNWWVIYQLIYLFVHLFIHLSIQLSIYLLFIHCQSTGGGLFGILGSYTNRWGRDTVVILGLFCHLICFYLTFLFLPDKAIAADVEDEDCYGALGKYSIYSKWVFRVVHLIRTSYCWSVTLKTIL